MGYYMLVAEFPEFYDEEGRRILAKYFYGKTIEEVLFRCRQYLKASSKSNMRRKINEKEVRLHIGQFIIA